MRAMERHSATQEVPTQAPAWVSLEDTRPRAISPSPKDKVCTRGLKWENSSNQREDDGHQGLGQGRNGVAQGQCPVGRMQDSGH